MFVTTISLEKKGALTNLLQEQGFEISLPPYTEVSGKKKGVSCTLYSSGKLVVQGKEAAPFIEFYLEPEILGNFSLSYPELALDMTPRIGIDESGKGDVFGPLCVAAIFGDAESITYLQKMGVKDSKKLSDAKILELAQKICAACPHYHVLTLYPEKYNELYERFQNLNMLLGWGHATVAEAVIQKSGCHKVTIDQFAGEYVVKNALKRKNLEVDLTQRHRGEEDIIVAAASILARAAFVNSLEKMSTCYGVQIIKGASSQTIQIGKQLVKQYSESVLRKTAKLHFKTIQQILA